MALISLVIEAAERETIRRPSFKVIGQNEQPPAQPRCEVKPETEDSALGPVDFAGRCPYSKDRNFDHEQ